MATALPASSEFTGAAQDEGDMKAVFTALRDYLAGLMGADGVTATAMATLGVALSSYVAKTANYTVLTSDKGKLIDAASGTWTLTLPAAATAGDAFNVSLKNSGTGVITVDPNLSESIDGGGTLAVNAGESVILYCNGTSWISVGKSSGVPSGAGVDWYGASLPSGYLWADGSAVSRATYASLFAAIGTTHGVGDGSSTFNLPDKRGRVSAGKDDMGGSAASRLTTAGSGVDGATLGASGGAQNVTLSGAESGLQSHSHGLKWPSAQSGGASVISTVPDTSTPGAALLASTVSQSPPNTPVALYSSYDTAAASASAASAHSNTQPTLVCNYIIKT